MDTVLVKEEQTLQQKIDAENEIHYILFVCTGNTCRSPMAAALWNTRYQDTQFRAVSAGLAADGSGISPNAVSALIRKGIPSTPENDYLSHISHTVNASDMEKADIVYGLTQRHAMQLMFAFPQYAAKISVLPMDICDPYGGDVDVYERCLNDIEAAFSVLFAKQEETEND